ncbi:MAG TPA: prolyl oligopeptidase family serine peptidase [Pyrinomonadaceae bacterium]|nr:prolyl oligopeptidase family serine peptidase [Pyrinomonadaceae bacterium]
MYSRILLLLIACVVVLCANASAQQLDRQKILDAIAKDGCTQLDQVKVCKYDYVIEGNRIEALSFQPAGEGKFPGLLLIPGYQRSAPDYLNLGRILGQQGFASVAVTQPGFGKSEGKADYVGPNTIYALKAGFDKFQHEPYVDKKKMGIFGYSRGGMAASLLAVRLPELRAAVFGAGIYDFKTAYDEIKMEGIRENMKLESGMTEKAIKDRSSLFQMKNLPCPVLILHGEKDQNVPVSQALLLRDRLTKLHKVFEIKLFPNAEHSIPTDEFVPLVIDFFNRRLRLKGN